MRFQPRLFWILFLLYGVLTAIVAAFFVTILFNRMRHVVDEQVDRRLHQAAFIVREQFRGVLDDQDSIDPIHEAYELRRLSGELGVQITLISRDGVPLLDSISETSSMMNVKNVSEINDARASPEGVGRSERRHSGISVIHYALRAGSRDKPRGYVRVTLPLDTVRARVASLRHIVIWASFAVIIISAGFTLIVHWWLSKPIDELTQAAQSISNGKYDQVVDSRRHDELGQLGHAFNQMSRHFSERVRQLDERFDELKHHRDQLQTVLTAMIEGVLVVDRDERVIVANEAALQLLDLGRSSHHGRPIWEVVRNVNIQQAVKQVLHEETHVTREFDLPRSQSRVSLMATRLPGEPCPGVLIVLHDVTELRRLENLRREFVSNVSHELKTPLTAIQAYAETLLDGALDDPDNRREFVRRIEEQAIRLHHLILDLLNLARIESVQQSYEVTPVSVEQVIMGCIEQRSPFAAAREIQLIVERPPSDVKVMADPEGLHTIIDNLVDNAIKYTPARGVVTIRWSEQSTLATISVSDTGVGIPKEHQSRIFERFYRVDKARSREMGGTGLGLSIVKHLSQIFGGSVEVVSQVGSGTTFSITLPTAESVVSPSAEAS